MMKLVNTYQIKQIFDKYTNEYWKGGENFLDRKVDKLDWKYVGIQEADDELLAIYKSDCYELSNGEMVKAYMSLVLKQDENWDVWYINSISYSEKVLSDKEEDAMVKELKDTPIEVEECEESNHICIDLNYYPEDIIESNFKEDNGREMTDADWDEYEKLYRQIEEGFLKDLESVGLVPLVSHHEGNGDFCLEFRVDSDNNEEIANLLRGSVLDYTTDREDCNYLQTYEVDYTEKYAKGQFKEFDNIVQGLTLYIPKGSSLYSLMGGE